ncbi:MAG TPA: hypothetical protein VFI49_11415 [Rudaea sp.]|nr:hypothetical protein [Rudaea sp.]
MPTPISPSGPFQLTVATWFALAAVAYVVYSIAVVLQWAPHALYADQWRQYLDYVNLPFPENVLHPDNGHRSVFPNLAAWIELRWLGGNQWLQIGLGVANMVAAAAGVAWICLRDREVPLAQRAAAAFLGAFAIFWLANVRTLAHSTELMHTSIPTMCLMFAALACLAATRNPDTERANHPYAAVLGAMALGVVATFSFGYGLATFVAIAAILIARKASRSQLLLWLAGLIVTAALYVGMPGGDGVRGGLSVAPPASLLIAARWLGAPFVVLFTYLWDPIASGLLPGGPLRRVAHGIAVLASDHLSDLHTSVMPYAAFGAFGMCALLWCSWRRLRAATPAGAMEALGLGIAWFGLASAVIVSVSRLLAFEQFPDQIYANRYLPWPCLFWLGLGLVALSNAGGSRRLLSRITFVFVVLLPLLAWPMQYGGRIFAALVRGQIDNTATGSIVGVVERGSPLGETFSDEFIRAVPVLRPLRIAQFASRAADMLGKPLPADWHALSVASIDVRTIEDNLLGDPGTAVTAHLPAAASSQPEELALVDANDVVVGFVVVDARIEPPGYSGYALGVQSAAGLHVASTN